MASKSETSRLILKLGELTEEQYALNIGLDNLLDEILNQPNPSKRMFEELEKLETRETEIILEKKQTREELTEAKAESVLNDEDRQRRRLASTRMSSFFEWEKNRHGMPNGDPAAEGHFVESQWEIHPEDIVVDERHKLGAGQFGTVFRGRLKGKDVAVKRLLVQKFENTKNEEEFKKEVKIMSSLRHPNLLLFMGACTKPGSMMMVVEIMDKGSVYELLHTKDLTRKLTFREKLSIAKGAAQGMSWLHGMNPAILHLDLKSANLLVDEHGVVKVADFGLSQIKKDQMLERVGSPLYMAPEMLRGEVYDAKADVFSFGICLWELLTEKDPYDNSITKLNDLIDRVAHKHQRPVIPDNTEPRHKELLNKCWHQDPLQRPNFDEMLKSNIFDEVIIDHSISELNHRGRHFWKMVFPGKYDIPWPVFLKAITQFCRWPVPGGPRTGANAGSSLTAEDIETRQKCLKAMLKADGSTVSKDVVTIENFGQMLDWFGPLEHNLLERVYQLVKQDYFWGFLSTSDADKTLDRKAGTYLVRFSNSERGVYTLSVITKDLKIANLRILFNVANGKFVLGPKEYETLGHIIQGKQIKTYNVSLKKSCQHDRPYSILFAKTDSMSLYMDPNLGPNK